MASFFFLCLGAAWCSMEDIQCLASVSHRTKSHTGPTTGPGSTLGSLPLPVFTETDHTPLATVNGRNTRSSCLLLFAVATVGSRCRCIVGIHPCLPPVLLAVTNRHLDCLELLAHAPRFKLDSGRHDTHLDHRSELIRELIH